MDSIQTSYTRAQLAAAVDEAHGHLHVWESQAGPWHPLHAAVTAAHEALHNVGAGLPRVGCATPDPEAQAIYADLQAMRNRPLPCGHKIEDLIGGTDPTTGKPEVTKCGQCLADKQAEREAAPRTPETVLRAMLRAYEGAALDVGVAVWSDPDNSTLRRREILTLGAIDPIRSAVVYARAGRGDPIVCLGHESRLGRDYEARLAGTRPLNAPPLES